MKSTDISQLFGVPFGAQADSTTIAPIPATKTAIGRASMALGFPKENFQPLDNGGQPVSGADLNGILNTLARSAQAAELGVLHPFSASYAQAIGGYPAGATIAHPTIAGHFLICTEDGNTNDPGKDMTGWVDPLAELVARGDLASYAAASALASEIKRAQAAEQAVALPVGAPIPWPSNTAPSGYILYDGRSFPLSANPSLAALFPSGNVLDMRGYFPRGLDTSGTVDSAAGRTVGSTQEGSYTLLTNSNPVGSPKLSQFVNPNDTSDIGGKYGATGAAYLNSVGFDAASANDPVVQFGAINITNWWFTGPSATGPNAAYNTNNNMLGTLGITRPKNIALNFIARIG